MPLESSPFVFFFTLFPAVTDTKYLPQKLQVNLMSFPVTSQNGDMFQKQAF